VDDVFMSVLGLYAERARAQGNEDLAATLAELYTFIVGEVSERHPPAIRLMDALCDEPDAGRREGIMRTAFAAAEDCSAKAFILTATELLRKMDDDAAADVEARGGKGGERGAGGAPTDPQLYAKLCVLRAQALALAPAEVRAEIFEGGMKKNGVPEDYLDAIRALMAEEMRGAEITGLVRTGQATLGGVLEAIEGVSQGLCAAREAANGAEGGPALENQLLMQSSSANDTLPRLDRIRDALVDRALLDASWSSAAKTP